MPQQLSSKDSSLFRSVVKHFESKQYKKGLKAAEQILRKNPNHGDTQAMKALIMNAQGHTVDAFALAKVALQNDMKSHVCWHVYGLLYRSEKNFEEAIKAYKFALRFEPDSVQIQRDLALLQIQMRDYQGYISSRKAMLQQRPGLRQNWTALAVAHHLAGELAAAENILNMYEKTLKQSPPKTDIEHSEAVLYKNTIIAESGETQRALDHLESIFEQNLDRVAVMELQAKYLLALGKREEAAKAYRALLDRNTENWGYYDGLEQSLNLDRTSTAYANDFAQLYQSYAGKNQRGDAARRKPLELLEGDDFKKAVDEYLQHMLGKGVPSTFANIKSLYVNPQKRQIITDLALGYSKDKQSNGSADKEVNGDTPERFTESLEYFLALHYDHPLTRSYSDAMKHIDRCIELSPKSVDYHRAKARIYKHAGALQKASEQMETARAKDEKDRYINTKCAKYQLRNNENDAALKTMSKFTRNEAVGGALGDLHDMQCMWFLTEDGEAHYRRRDLGLALKRFKAVGDIFDIWQEDQFDFHSFSLRKGQIRAYVDMVRWEDSLRSHPFFTRAALAAIQIYCLLHDHPGLVEQHLANGVDISKMDAKEKKKALQKARKEQEKAEAERKEAERKAASKKANASAEDNKKEDQDPKGLKLLETQDPLGEATKYLTPILEMSPDNAEAQKAGFEVFIRRQKYLLALKCLLALAQASPKDPSVHEFAVRLRHALQSPADPIPAKVSNVINAQFTMLKPSDDVTKHNEEYLTRHKNSFSHVVAGLRARQAIDPKSQSSNEKALEDMLSSSSIQPNDARRGLDILKAWGSDTDVQNRYRTAAQKHWPDVTFW